MTSGYGGYGVMVGDNGNPIPQSIPKLSTTTTYLYKQDVVVLY